MNRPAIHILTTDGLESRLREEVSALVASGLAEDEAFMVAVKRMGDLDAASHQLAREQTDRLWRRLDPSSGQIARPGSMGGIETSIVVFVLAAVVALAIKLPELVGYTLNDNLDFYARNLSLFALPFLTAYFAWNRKVKGFCWFWLAIVFVAAAVFANAYPLGEDTWLLTVLHLPIALWLAVGVAYTGGRWPIGSAGMDFARFSGEFFLYYVLTALGGGVLAALTLGMFAAIGIDALRLVTEWVLPCGAAGAVIVCAWMVDVKPGISDKIAPALARVFTPLTAAVLLVFLSAMISTGRGIKPDPEALIIFDLMLALVVGLLLYAVSSRDRHIPPNAFDWLSTLLVVSALFADVVALAAIAVRIFDLGFSAHRMAALGENLVLLLNLACSAWLYVGFIRGRSHFARLERWQSVYLPVYSIWAGFVVVAFPPLFGFM